MKKLKSIFVLLICICFLLTIWNQLYYAYTYCRLNDFLAPDKGTTLLYTVVIVLVFIFCSYLLFKGYRYISIFISMYCFWYWFSGFSLYVHNSSLWEKIKFSFSTQPPDSYFLVMFLAFCFLLFLFLADVYEAITTRRTKHNVQLSDLTGSQSRRYFYWHVTTRFLFICDLYILN